MFAAVSSGVRFVPKIIETIGLGISMPWAVCNRTSTVCTKSVGASRFLITFDKQSESLVCHYTPQRLETVKLCLGGKEHASVRGHAQAPLQTSLLQQSKRTTRKNNN